MNLMVNPTITGFRQEVDGTIKELKLGEAKEDAWANIAEQGASAKLDNNKTATINVSTYTDPVEITPTSGKDGMKKATVTLSNIPQIEANKAQTINVSTYTEAVEIEPTSPNDAMAKATITLSNIPSGATTLYAWRNSNDYAYTLTETPTTSDKLLHVTSSSVTSFGWYDIGYVTEEGIAANESSPIYVRYSSDDVSLT